MTKRKAPPVALAGDLDLNSQHGGPQLRRRNPGRTRFDKERRRRFLDALTLCCNISMSAEHAGVHVGTVYAARTRDPIFGEQWREALGMGLERLEAMVVEHGGAGLPLEPANPERALADLPAPPPFDFAKAIQALQIHAKFWAGIERKPNVAPATAAETDAAITLLLGRMNKRAAIERRALPALPAPDGAERA